MVIDRETYNQSGVIVVEGLLTILSVSSRMRFCRMLSTVCSETGCCQLKLNFPRRAGESLGNPILWALSYVHKRRQTQTMSP